MVTVMAVNPTYRRIISEIESGGKTKVDDRTKELLSTAQGNLHGAFTWTKTVEGAEFWNYVSMRLTQLGEGYGWKD